MARFTLPRDIWYGKGALQTLSTLRGQRAMIVVGGGSMKKNGFLQRAQQYLEKAGFAVELFENVEPDPSVETVLRGAEAMRDFEPDWIVAMGGGSPMDAAKAMWAFYEHPDTRFEDLITPFRFPTLRGRARFAAVPSTSGTASEVTAFSVITDYEAGIKYPLADYEITPDVAILDPELAATMPPKLAAHTGMDALTHAVEAFVSTAASPFTDPLAMKAVEMVLCWLPRSVEGDEQAREQMHYAQCLAGMAFTNALLGIVHSMAHKTGAAFRTGHVPHGCANAIYLPYVIAFNRTVCADRYAELARYAGIGWQGETDPVEALARRIEEYNERFGIPRSLREFGVEEAEFLEKLPELARLAVADACTASNPRAVSEEEMQRLLRCVYYGEKVDF